MTLHWKWGPCALSRSVFHPYMSESSEYKISTILSRAKKYNLFTWHFYGDEIFHFIHKIGRNVCKCARVCAQITMKRQTFHMQNILDLLIRFIYRCYRCVQIYVWLWIFRVQGYVYTFAFEQHYTLQCDHCCNAYISDWMTFLESSSPMTIHAHITNMDNFMHFKCFESFWSRQLSPSTHIHVRIYIYGKANSRNKCIVKSIYKWSNSNTIPKYAELS